MSDITLRLVKGSPLTNQEVDDNFANLNTDKYQAGDSASFQDVTLDNMTGPITWNTDDGALDIPLNAQVTLQAGQEFVFYAKATEAIANGDVVMFAGAQGGHLLIAKCNMGAVGFDPSHIVGIATQSFANNEFGYVTSKGKVRSLDTSGFTEGDILYVDPTTAGGFTATKPAPPNHIVQVAAVTRSHATQGTVLTRVSHMPDTDEVPEGSTNLYFTDARAVSAIKADGDWNASNWDTAYGWGDHSTQNYAATTGDTFTGVVTLPQLRFDNLEKTNLSGTYGTVAFDLNDGDAPTDLGTYGSSYPLGLYVRDADGVISTIYHTGHFTGTHISNWNTAYGWGDHSTQGYLTSFDITTQTDPKYLRSDTNDTYTGLLSLGSSGSRIDGSDTYPLVQVNASRAYFGSTSRSKSVLASSDKIFHVRAGTEYEIFTTHNFTDNSTNWNTAYGWGDHSTQNYATQTYVNNAVSNLVDSSPSTLDTLNELAAALGDDPNFATTVSNSIGTKWTQNNTKISNWDTAYGWGNHASAGYLTSYSETDTLQSVTARGNTTGRDIIISKTSPMLRLYDSNTSTGNYPRIDFDTANNQGISIEFNEFDGELPTSGYGLVMGPSTTNTQFPTTGTLSLSVLGEIYAGGTTLTSLNKVFHDEYHPNADKWTTPRSHTVTLTGQVTGSATQSVDGTGNRTWSIATTLNDSALDDQYVTVGSRYSGNADSLIQNNKASVRIWDVSTATDDPSGAQDGLVYSAGWDSTSWGVQQYHDFHQNSLYLRSKQSGTMGSWSRVYTDDYHPISWNELSDKPSIDNSVDYINAASFNTSNGVLTLSGVGRAGATVDLDNRYKINNNTYRWSLDSVGNITDSRYYKLATVNIGNGGLRIEGTFSNHVESFGTQTVDLSIFGRELNSNIDIEIAGSIDVAASGTGTGIYVIKATDSSVYHTYDVYAVIPKYSQVELDLTKTGITSLHLPYSSSFVTTKPSGISVELDASLLSEGSYVVQDSEIYENYHTGNLNPVTGLTHDTVNTELDVTFADGTTQSLDLAQYLDDTNLSRVVSGSHVGSGIVRFVREDATTFDVDFSDFFDDTNLARITSASWNTSNGVLTLTRNDSSTVAVDLDGRYYNTGESDGRYVRKTGDTMTGNLTIEDSVLEVGNKSADNYVEISQFTGSSDFGFTFQHANASVFKNLQGGTNQILALGDVDPNVDSTLLGVSVLKDGTYHNRLDLRGNGSMYIGSGTDRVFADNYHPNADKWTTARTITLGGDLTGSVSIDGSSNVTLSAQVVNDSHTHDTRYVQQGGTSFSGEYGMVVRVSDRNFYSDGNIKFRGSDSRLTVDGIVNTPTYQVNGTTVISSNKNIEFVRGSSGTLASRTGFSDFIGYNPSYGSYIGGGVSNASNYIYSGGYISKNGVHTLWHSGNDGSGSGLDADSVDGRHASQFTFDNFVDDAYIDFTVNGDANTYYPVTMYGSAGFGFQRYSFSRRYNWTAPSTWNTSSHKGGLTFTIEWCSDGAWGGNNKDLRVVQFHETYSTMVGGMGLSVGGGGMRHLVVWLRGGGATYRLHAPNGKTASVDVRYSDTTASNGTVFSPRSYSSSTVISEIYTKYAVRGNSSLYDGNNKVWHAGNDGSGSGLDADLLDGQHASAFASASHSHSNYLTTTGKAADSNLLDGIDSNRFVYGSNSNKTTNGDPSTLRPSGFYDSYSGNSPTSTYYSYINMRHTNEGNGHGHQIAGSFYSNGDLYNRHYDGNGSFDGWSKIWNTSNDGSGSGLDADLLDGIHAGSFIRSDANDTASGQYNFTKVNDHAIQVGTVRGRAVGSQTGQYIHLYDRVHIGSPSGWGSRAAPSYGLSTYGGADFCTDTGSVRVGDNISQTHGGLQILRNGGVPSSSGYSVGNGAHIEIYANNNPVLGFHNSGNSACSLYEDGGDLYLTRWNGTATGSRLWHSNNDGSGSGLDADLLDGNHASAFVLKTGGTISGTLTLQTTNDAQLYLNGNGSTWAGIAWTDVNSTDYMWYRGATGTFAIGGGGSSVSGKKLHIDGGTTIGANLDGTIAPSNGLKVEGEIHDNQGGVFSSYTHSGSDFVNGTLVQTDIPATATNGASYVLEVTGKSYSSSAPFSFIAQGYLYNNTIISHSGTNLSGYGPSYIKAMEYNGNLCFWWPRISYWNSFEVRVRDAGGSPVNRVTDIGNATEPSASKKVQTNLSKAWTTVTDGSGSGLDADLLDGQHASAFASASHSHSNYMTLIRSTYSSDTLGTFILSKTDGGFSGSKPPGSHNGVSIISTQTHSGNYFTQLALDTSQNQLWIRSANNSSSYGGWTEIWASNNDGSGSGLDADLLDGVQGSSYMRTTSETNLNMNSYNITDVNSLSVQGAITAGGNITAYSDSRLKDNVETLDGSKVYEMRGVSFTKDGVLGSGVIAQELEKVAPELVMTNDDEMQTKSVAYGNLVGYLIEALKEQKTQLNELQAQIKSLKER